MKTRIQSILVVITFLFPGLLLKVQAVTPPPDGCYPSFTTAEGCDALKFLSTGTGNTGLGWRSLFSDATGNFNTAVGTAALVLNNADSNTAVGAAALLLNTTGTENTAIGTASLLNNNTAQQNTATGAFALSNHVSGNGNTAIGANALFSDATGQVNTAVGAGALFTVNSGFNGSFNTAIGAGALSINTSADNTAVGGTALGNNTAGHDNTAVGISALPNNTSGSNNVALGAFAGQAVTTSSNVICIGVQGSDTDNSCFIGSIFGQTTNLGSAVFIDANNKLGTMTSSKRYKEDIKPMDELSKALFALKPVSFRYKKQFDPAGTSQFGLVAEDVEKVSPDLVVRDKDGKPYSVRYDQVNAMLLNEFIKEHKKVEEQQGTIADLKSEMKTLAARVQEQAVELRDVKTQMQIKSSASVIAGNY
jgi:trimeric autotransporter adhesin